MFGDIISDLCAQLVGGLGFAAAGNIGDKYAVFEPTHGSAPKYAGMYKVNPIAMFLAAKLMLDWLGETDKRPGSKRPSPRSSRTARSAPTTWAAHPPAWTWAGRWRTSSDQETRVGRTVIEKIFAAQPRRSGGAGPHRLDGPGRPLGARLRRRQRGQELRPRLRRSAPGRPGQDLLHLRLCAPASTLLRRQPEACRDFAREHGMRRLRRRPRHRLPRHDRRGAGQARLHRGRHRQPPQHPRRRRLPSARAWATWTSPSPSRPAGPGSRCPRASRSCSRGGRCPRPAPRT